jgi:hypothetical protein
MLKLNEFEFHSQNNMSRLPTSRECFSILAKGQTGDLCKSGLAQAGIKNGKRSARKVKRKKGRFQGGREPGRSGNLKSPLAPALHD